MSRDKQIEEMTEAVYESGSHITYWRSSCKLIAEALYNAGYRKSADLAEEIFAEIDEIFERQIYESRWLDQNGKVLGGVDVFYAFECWRDYIKPELKKKYTESEKDNG